MKGFLEIQIEGYSQSSKARIKRVIYELWNDYTDEQRKTLQGWADEMNKLFPHIKIEISDSYERCQKWEREHSILN